MHKRYEIKHYITHSNKIQYQGSLQTIFNSAIKTKIWQYIYIYILHSCTI